MKVLFKKSVANITQEDQTAERLQSSGGLSFPKATPAPGMAPPSQHHPLLSSWPTSPCVTSLHSTDASPLLYLLCYVTPIDFTCLLHCTLSSTRKVA